MGYPALVRKKERNKEQEPYRATAQLDCAARLRSSAGLTTLAAPGSLSFPGTARAVYAILFLTAWSGCPGAYCTEETFPCTCVSVGASSHIPQLNHCDAADLPADTIHSQDPLAHQTAPR